MGTIIPVEEITKLKDIILSYDKIVETMSHGMNSNNEKFCNELDKIVTNII